MASSINADNGVVSGSAGLKSTADSTGVLALQTNGTTAISIDASQAVSFTNAPTVTGGTANGVAYLNGSKVLTTGSALVFDGSNLGVGVTPSAWNTGGKAIEVKNGGNALYCTGTNTLYQLSNAFLNSAGDFKYSSTNFATQYTQYNGTHSWHYAPSGTAGNTASFTQAMTLDASGRLGIGQTSPQFPLHITGASGVATYAHFTNATTGNTASDGFSIGVPNGASDAYIIQRESANLFFYTNALERAAIDASGNFIVGAAGAVSNSAAGAVLTQAGYVRSIATGSTNAATTYEAYSTGAGAFRFYVGLGGTVYATSTTITAISDQRLKENIRDLDDGLASVMALKPRKFDWKEGKGQDIKNARGFIAQEFESVFPDMIDEWRDPAPEGEEPYKAINANLIPTLVKAIQEQQALITQLTARITALESA